MGYLGIPERVIYEAINMRAGLTDVRALIIKPDNSFAGPYILREFPTVLAGRYYFDFISTDSDPEGNYIVGFVSPTERIKTTGKFPLNKVPAINSALLISVANSLLASAAQISAISNSLAALSLPTSAEGIIEDNHLTAEIEIINETQAVVEDQNIEQDAEDISTFEIEATVEASEINS